MTFEDLSKQLNTSVQSLQNLVQVLSAAFSDIEGGSSGADYSVDEVDTGLKWSDGKTLYRKNLPFSGVSLTSGQNHILDNLTDVSLKMAYGFITEGSLSLTLPDAYMRITYASGNVRLSALDSWNNVSGEVVIYYTKG